MDALDEDDKLDYCSTNCSGDIVDFIDDLIAFKKNYGYLTDKQAAALNKIYDVQHAKDSRVR